MARREEQINVPFPAGHKSTIYRLVRVKSRTVREVIGLDFDYCSLDDVLKDLQDIRERLPHGGECNIDSEERSYETRISLTVSGWRPLTDAEADIVEDFIKEGKARQRKLEEDKEEQELQRYLNLKKKFEGQGMSEWKSPTSEGP